MQCRITLYGPIASPGEFSGTTVEFPAGEPVEILMYKTDPNKERVKKLTLYRDQLL